jgi:integrase/recombinase XerD
MASQDRLTLEETLAAFDEHLRRARGLGSGTRRNYGRFVRMFLLAVFGGGPGWGQIAAPDVVGFVAGPTGWWRPRTVEGAAAALRSFVRFLRAEGLRDDRLDDVVPMVPHRPTGLVRHLEPWCFEQLIASLDASSPRGLRDRAIIWCIARLGLRAGEACRGAGPARPRRRREGPQRVRARKTAAPPWCGTRPPCPALLDVRAAA